jgi:hypothetical protein
MKDIDIKKLVEFVNNGLMIKEISLELKISVSTVKRLMSKNGLNSKVNFLKNEVVNCLNCQVEFKSYISDSRKFCSKSCSATFNNKKRCLINEEKRKKENRKHRPLKNFGLCLNCNVDIIRENNRNGRYPKYCSLPCQAIFRMSERVLKGIASTKTLKLFLVKNNGEKCMKCGWCEKNPITNKVPIELEHKDGNSENNNLDNLELLCPNCHSLTSTYKALNKGKGRHKRRERYKEGKSY